MRVSTEPMKKALLALAAVLLLAALTACGGEGTLPSAADDPAESPAAAPAPSPTPVPLISFAAGEASADTRQLEMTLAPGETALLEQLPALESLDAGDSDCWEELAAWAQAHP